MWNTTTRASLMITRRGSPPTPPSESEDSEPRPRSWKKTRCTLHLISFGLSIATLVLMFATLTTVQKRLESLGSMFIQLDAGDICGSSVALALALIFTLLSQATLVVGTFLNRSEMRPYLITASNIILVLGSTIPTTVTFSYKSASSAPIPSFVAMGFSQKYSELGFLLHFIITAWCLVGVLTISAAIDWWTYRSIKLYSICQSEEKFSETTSNTA